jgi:hypothetical protein
MLLSRLLGVIFVLFPIANIYHGKEKKIKRGTEKQRVGERRKIKKEIKAEGRK